MKTRRISYAGLCLVLGAGVGTSFGVIIDQIAVMAGIGAGVGLIIGAVIDSYKSKTDQN